MTHTRINGASAFLDRVSGDLAGLFGGKRA
jgi:hypothetical protein